MSKEIEQPEVVAWRNAALDSVTTSAIVVTDWDDSDDPVESLMTIAQHKRIMAVLNDERDALAAQLAELKKKEPHWKKGLPTQKGAYYVRGFRLFEPDSPPALVEIADDNDEMVCNLHECNSQYIVRSWSLLMDFNEEFEWLGPLQSGAHMQPDVPEGWKLVPVECTAEIYDAIADAAEYDKECDHDLGINVWMTNPDEVYRAMLAAAPRPVTKDRDQ